MPDQKGIASTLILILLFVGIGLGVYLISQKTNLLPKASDQPSEDRTPETGFTLQAFKRPNDPETADPAVNTTQVTNFSVGETFKVKVKVASDFDEANRFVAKIKFPTDKLQAIRINPEVASNSGSLRPDPPFFISKWIEQTMDNQTGTVSLIGRVNQGFKTDPNAPRPQMANIIFKVIAPGAVKLRFGPATAIYKKSDDSNISVTNHDLNLTLTEKSAQSEYSQIKGVTYFKRRGMDKVSFNLQSLKRDIPTLKSLGFNTVWLVSFWTVFNPKPLSDPPVYNDQAFNQLRQALRFLKDNNMKAILPLNYFGTGPEGIDHCDFIYNPKSYNAFESYVKEYLTRIQNFSDMTYIMFFEEGLSGCTKEQEETTFADPGAYTAQLRATIGSLPERLPSELRSKFKIGWHDQTLIGLNWRAGLPWKNPTPNIGTANNPLKQPLSYDFVSGGFYGLEDKTESEIIADTELHISRFKQLYPNTPFLAGEVGASKCASGSNEDIQAGVLKTKVSYMLDHGYGLNVWGYSPDTYTSECIDKTDDLSINAPDQVSPRKAALELKRLFNP